MVNLNKVKKLIVTIFCLFFIITEYSGQSAYYWNNGKKIAIKQTNKKYFVLTSNADDTTLLKQELLSNKVVNVETFREYAYYDSGLAISKKYWTVFYCNDSIDLYNIKSVGYVTPFYENEHGDLFGVSHLFYVKLKNESDVNVLESFAKKYNVKILNRNKYMPLWYTLSCELCGNNSLDMANLFYESGLFAVAVPSVMVDNIANCANDYHYQSQWALKSTSSVNIHYCSAKEITTGSSSVIVAVLDSGIDTNHPDLSNIYTYSYDTETYGSSVVYDDHGTKSAGIIGASANNSLGIAGIAPSSPLMSISNSLMLNVNMAEQMADGINHAYLNGASVINNSWGRNTLAVDSAYINEAINNALTLGRNGKGCVVVFSSGNNNYSEVEYPSSVSGVIAVGAVDSCGILSGRSYNVPNSCDPWFKSYPGSSFGSALSVVAPGSSVWTTTLNGNYSPHGGTSAAAPHVSAVAALMLSVNSNLTAAQVKTIIEKTAQKVGGYNYQIDNIHPNGTWCDSLGYGLVNAHAAVMEAYFYDYTINGNASVQSCSEPQYSLSSTNVPNGTSFYWETSDNLEIISAQGAPNITVRPIGYGTGWVRVNLIHENDTVKKIKNIMVTSGYSTYYNNYTTNGPMTIGSTSVIAGTFTISNGSTVTISSIAKCSPNAKIIILPGGKLVVNGGTLTNLCPGKMWDGIYVKGNKTQRQLAQYQGTLEVKNNALIENAKCAIHNWDGSDSNTSGGIVKVTTGSVLRNNGVAAHFKEYTNTDVTGAQTNDESTFNRCNFVINDDNFLSANSLTFENFVRMEKIFGVSFKGCDFADRRTTVNNQTKGINSLGSKFTVDQYCPTGVYNQYTCECVYAPTRSNFHRLGRAVDASDSGTVYSFDVRRTDFDTCYRSVAISAINNFAVTESDFDMNISPTFSFSASAGVNISNSSGYTVEGNTFHADYQTYPTSSLDRGVYISKSGDDANAIYRNTFDKMNYGIYAYSNNSGLQIQCNEFTNSRAIDIRAIGYIGSPQGTSTKSAGNEFTASIPSYNITTNYNTTYYYSGLGNSSNPYYPNVVNSHVSSIGNATANPCASTLCPQFPINPKSAPISDDITLYESLQQEYDSRLAEYDAAGYGFLLENFDEEDADIVALARLKQDTLITIHRAMAEIANRNIDAILQDTLVFDRESLNGWYNRINTQTAKYSLVNSYFEVGEYALARQELATIPQRFALTTDELAEYDNFCQYQSLRESVYASGRNYAQFTETEIAELQTIAERNTGVSSAYANSVLCFFYGICRDEELDLDFDIDAPMNSKSTTAVAESDAEQLAIYVYPNPADEDLNILLNSLPEGRTTIEFHDVTGRLVLSEEIKSNSTSINISSLRQGVYMYRIVNGDNVIARDRIVKE